MGEKMNKRIKEHFDECTRAWNIHMDQAMK